MRTCLGKMSKQMRLCISQHTTASGSNALDSAVRHELLNGMLVVLEMA